MRAPQPTMRPRVQVAASCEQRYDGIEQPDHGAGLGLVIFRERGPDNVGGIEADRLFLRWNRCLGWQQRIVQTAPPIQFPITGSLYPRQ